MIKHELRKTPTPDNNADRKTIWDIIPPKLLRILTPVIVAAAMLLSGCDNLDEFTVVIQACLDANQNNTCDSADLPLEGFTVQQNFKVLGIPVSRRLKTNNDGRTSFLKSPKGGFDIDIVPIQHVTGNGEDLTCGVHGFGKRNNHIIFAFRPDDCDQKIIPTHQTYNGIPATFAQRQAQLIASR